MLADGQSAFRMVSAEYLRGHVSSSLPFDSGGRLRRDVVADAVDAANLVDDARGYLCEDLVREVVPVGCHEIRGRNGTQGNKL